MLLKVLTVNYKDVFNTLRIITNSYILVIQSKYLYLLLKKNCLINGFFEVPIFIIKKKLSY